MRLPPAVTNLLLFAGLVLAWVFLAPTRLGGQTSYVIIHGNSMEPRFHTGDLVLVRKASSYQIGDIVTYWDESMASYVIHRIIDIRQGRFILQGDNNPWMDPVQPGHEDIVGKFWIHLPRIGRQMEWLRTPLNFALVMGLGGGVLMTGMVVKPKRNSKKEFAHLNPTGSIGIAVYIFGALFLAFLAFSLYALSRPVSTSSKTLLYQQEGLFSYSATGTPGIYDSDTVQTGEPVFPKLTCLLNVEFSYNLVGNQVHSVSGSHQIYARVLDQGSGWSRTIPMGQVMSFSGTSFFNTGTIDLCQVEALVANLEQETGLRSSAYNLEIVSAVAVAGNIAGETISDTFSPSLTFRFDEAHFYIDATQKGEDMFRASQPGMSNYETLQANTLSLLGLQLKVQTARILALSGLFLSICCLAFLLFYVYSAVKQDQQALIRLKYAALLVDVYEGTYEPAPPVIDVTSIDNLAKLAERHSTMILHITRDFLHDYLVQADRATYRYSVSVGVPRMSVQRSMHQETARMVSSKSQSSAPFNTLTSYQDLHDWGDIQPSYDLDATQPTKIEQPAFEENSYQNSSVYEELDQTKLLRKIKL